MTSKEQPVKTISAGVVPYALIVPDKPVTDQTLSLADLGLYVRCLWLLQVCGDVGDVDWFIREFGMPEKETAEGLRRLVDAGYLEVPMAEFVESKTAYERAQAIRAALAELEEKLDASEHAAVARLAGMVEGRGQRAHDIWAEKETALSRRPSEH